MGVKDELFGFFSNGDSVARLVFVNCAVFLVVGLSDVLLWLSGSGASVAGWLSLPASFPSLLCRPWSLLTYSFTHQQFVHFIINVLMLHWAGRLFVDYCSARGSIVGLYLLGALGGAVAFVLAFAFVPPLSLWQQVAFLQGASASVMAIMVASATLSPNTLVSLPLVGSFRIKWLVLAMVAVSLLSVHSCNPGGAFSHLGGALVGWAHTVFSRRGVDIGSFWPSLCGFFSRLFSRLFSRKPKFRIVPPPQGNQASSGPVRFMSDACYNQQRRASSQQVDAILDKICASGFDSLSADEKKALLHASRQDHPVS